MADAIIEWVVEKIIPWLLIMMVPAIFAIIGFLVYEAATAPVEAKVTLTKSEWVCTQSHNQVVIINQQIGKVMIPRAHNQTVCDQWSRQP